jgi:chemotaxis protein CheZ
MAGGVQAKTDRLAMARNLVSHLEQGNDRDAAEIIATLAGTADGVLFREIGRLTRELHESVKGFVVDARLPEIAENDIPDATERLRYVITMTEQAANATLAAVEDGLPLTDTLRSGAHQLSERWERFQSRDDLGGLGDELTEFLRVAQENSKELHAKLSEVLLAQSFQDLTGQVIRRVIDLVNDVEQKLVELIRLSGAQASKGPGPRPAPRGPAVPGVDDGDVVRGQDEVDDLLSSLGF